MLAVWVGLAVMAVREMATVMLAAAMAALAVVAATAVAAQVAVGDQRWASGVLERRASAERVAMIV